MNTTTNGVISGLWSVYKINENNMIMLKKINQICQYKFFSFENKY